MVFLRSPLVRFASICGLFAVTAAAAVRAPGVGEPRFEGEYGLYVGVREDGFEVGWLTDVASPGVLRARAGEEVVREVETPAAQSHRAVIETDAEELVLEYGAAGALHRTIVSRDPPPADLAVAGADSVYMFGDVHGEFERVARLLHGAGLIDADFRWTGGARQVVFLGDLFDRGDDVTRVLWFLYGLSREAAGAGGGVHVVLGNHELMVMAGDLRYVSGKETMVAFRHGMSYADLFDPRESVLGRWLATRPGLMKVDDILLAHGGITPAYDDYSLEEFRDTLRAFIAEDLFQGWYDAEFLQAFGDSATLDSAAVARRHHFFFNRQSVFWNRNLVRTDTLGAFLEQALGRYDASLHVVGHTPVDHIQERYGGLLIVTDLTEAASEMLFLDRREDGGWERYRIPLFGDAVPLAEGGTCSIGPSGDGDCSAGAAGSD